MSALPKVVVAHPSALRRLAAGHPAAAANAGTHAPASLVSAAAGEAVSPAKAGAQSNLGSRLRANDAVRRALAMLTGLALFSLLWAFISSFGRIPGPVAVLKEAATLFAHPFYRNGPNDQGIGWNVLTSLGRVGVGFGLAAAVGIPLGFVIGRFRFASDMAAPIIALLKPVSPLAWLPIGLLVFKAANPASIYVIFVCSLWPMIVNTAAGVRQIPQDYLNVARVLNLSEWRTFTRILLPAVLPYMLTGVRLSIGVAWLVIVAAEMLTGGVGIGFWVWDEWNNLKVDHIIIAILVIGVVGLALEQALIFVARRVSRGVRV